VTLRARGQERARESKRERERDLRKGNRDWKAGMFNVSLLLSQLKVGIGRKALFLYKKENNGMLHLPMFRGCNRCCYVHQVNGDNNRKTKSALGMGW
jgi:hypothetical protein